MRKILEVNPIRDNTYNLINDYRLSVITLSIEDEVSEKFFFLFDVM